MNILFIHRSFPAQFKHLASEFAKNPDNLVMFITKGSDKEIVGVNKLVYLPTLATSNETHPYLQVFEECIIHGQAVRDIALAMKTKGITPDIIVGFPWGTTLFIKDIFPDVPFLCYFEWFGRYTNSVWDFDNKNLLIEKKIMIKMNNSHLLNDLCNCDAGISPTEWQKSQFPKEFQNKIKVLHDGIDTDFYKPDNDVKFSIPEKNLEFTTKDEIITYATRGMEPYRGFPQFMEAVEKLLKKRPNAHFLIAGANAVCYGENFENINYKQLMLEKLDIDLNRVHFVGTLPSQEYLKLLQVSSTHVYLTYPMILSWSALDAMSTGCCIVTSNTPPVVEVMKDNYNGLLVDFFEVNQLVDKIEYALDNKNKMQSIRENARKTILDKYALKNLLPKQIEYINNIIENIGE